MYLSAEKRRHKTYSKLFILITLFIVSLLGVLAVGQRAVSANSSIVSASICSDDVGSLALSIESPVDDYTSASPTIDFSGYTSWAVKLYVQKDGQDVIVPIDISYEANQDFAFSVIVPSPGLHTYTIKAVGGCGAEDVVVTKKVRYGQTLATINSLYTSDTSPRLDGDISSTTDKVFVAVNGNEYEAVNNGDGTWYLPDNSISPALTDGTYSVRVYTKDANTGTVVSDVTQNNVLIIDTIAPTGTYTDEGTRFDRSPRLKGTVDDPGALIQVTANGIQYSAVNKGDGTWYLPQGTIGELASGSYTIEVRFVDRVGNASVISGTLVIDAENELGFVLAPNSGFVRVMGHSLYTRYFYTVGAAIIATSIYVLALRKYKLSLLGTARHKKRKN